LSQMSTTTAEVTEKKKLIMSWMDNAQQWAYKPCHNRSPLRFCQDHESVFSQFPLTKCWNQAGCAHTFQN
jgi:hypothetical protein